MFTTLYTQVSSIHVNVTEYSIYYISPGARDVMWNNLINIAEEWDWSIVVWLVSWCSSWCVQPRCSALLFVPRLHSHCHQITPRLRKAAPLHVIRVGQVRGRDRLCSDFWICGQCKQETLILHDLRCDAACYTASSVVPLSSIHADCEYIMCTPSRYREQSFEFIHLT